jgi:hypothetical protein
MALYFCHMAAFAWWACLALAWFLAAGLKWGHEAIESKSHLFHLTAWAIPTVQTIIVVLLGKVEGKHKGSTHVEHKIMHENYAIENMFHLCKFRGGRNERARQNIDLSCPFLCSSRTYIKYLM